MTDIMPFPENYYETVLLDRPEAACFHWSGLFDELFPALGAGNGDLALALGHPDGLAALGTGVIAVVPILELIHQQEELAVLLIALVGVAGEAPHQGDGQQGVHAHGQDQIEELVAHEHGQHTQHQTHDQKRHIQSVVTITTHHEALDSASHIHTGLSQPASRIFHRDHLFCKDSMPIIWLFSPIATGFTESSQKIRIPVTDAS